MEYSNQAIPQRKLKAFKTIQKYFALIGINQKLATQSYPLLNGRILMGFLLLSMGIICVSAQIFTDAETFFEYTQSVYMVSDGFLMISALLILSLKVGKLFEIINCCDSMLNMSKFENPT